ncbi:MAG: sigma-70 family RNA polymerase sigma factor [Bacteroidetes bacterium]|nr:sigma-70 family RNA polymerase sigma factor [Bacteroidota bacterium]
MSDQEIISLIQADKQNHALLRLYKHYPGVEHFLIMHGASKEEAQDIYQDALYVFCKKVKEGNLTLTVQLNTYLYSICKLMWKVELRKKNKNALLFSEIQDETANYDSEELEKISRAEKAWESLGDKCWEILKAFYHEGMSMAKIAMKFSFSTEKSAKNQKYKCLEKAKLKYNELATQNYEQLF